MAWDRAGGGVVLGRLYVPGNGAVRIEFEGEELVPETLVGSHSFGFSCAGDRLAFVASSDRKKSSTPTCTRSAPTAPAMHNVC